MQARFRQLCLYRTNHWGSQHNVTNRRKPQDKNFHGVNVLENMGKILLPFLVIFERKNNPAMNHWLIKTEPDTFSWDDLVKEKISRWDGVRNFQARKNLKAMKKGDLAFFYHTGDEKAIVGIARVVKEFYPEPHEPDWVAVDIAPDRKLGRTLPLSEIKQERKLAQMVLVKAARLSVQPVTPAEFKVIEQLTK